jgi:nucleotide-binding universal stress UspA family protein
MLPDIKKILYTTDLSDTTRPVFEFAVSVAKAHNAKLFLLHVVEPLSDASRFLIEAYLSEEMTKQAEAMTKALHEQTSQRVLHKIKSRVEQFYAENLGTELKPLELLAEVRVVSGSPAEVIVREAETGDMDLVIVGSHSGFSLKRTLMGSTARQVTLMSKKPVLLVPMPETASWGD